jgi:hypothetical protein
MASGKAEGKEGCWEQRFSISETAVPSSCRGGTAFLECRYQMAVLLSDMRRHIAQNVPEL